MTPRGAGITLERIGIERGSRTAKEKAERVPVGVEHDPDMRLWLMLGGSRTERLRTADRRIEVVGSKVEVHHHLLSTDRRRPPRLDVRGFVLEGEPDSPCWRLKFHPAPFVVEPVPPQQPLVEVGEPLWTRTANDGGRDIHARLIHDAKNARPTLAPLAHPRARQ